MNLLAGLEKFGLSTNGELDITKDEKGSQKQQAAENKEAEKVLKESDFLLEKVVQCPVCDRKFKTLTVKTGKAKRLEPDEDLFFPALSVVIPRHKRILNIFPPHRSSG